MKGIRIEIGQDPKLKKVTVIKGVTDKATREEIKSLLKEKISKCVICRRKTGDIIVQRVGVIKEIAEVVAKTVGIEIDNIDVPKLYTK